jgi:hypothetical protein
MPLQNRVTPFGEIIAVLERGTLMGNRGILHDDAGRIVRSWQVRRWIACRTAFRGRQRQLLQPHSWTELFFLDEATAFAAGHRPCALCRREDYDRFVRIWQELHPGQAGADAIDAQLHSERLTPAREQRHHEVRLEELPDGAFVLHEDAPHLVLGSELRRWTPSGYASASGRFAGAAVAITPPSLVHVLRVGWEGVVPLVHPSPGR